MEHQNTFRCWISRQTLAGVANNNAIASAVVKVRAQKDRLGMAICQKRMAVPSLVGAW